jgi:N-acetylglucosaminyldiphosphoundecaprenol N-acetyl-beta-D-mannosaminyltransferase
MQITSKRINILGSPIDALTMKETVEIVDRAIMTKNSIRHVVVNAAKLVNMRKDKELHQSVITCDIINADGQSVVWASRFLREPLPERVAGIDLMEKLVALAHKKKYKVFLLGAKEEVVKKVCSIYSAKYSPEIIAGYQHGYFKSSEEQEIAEHIEKSEADMLFVAISSPKKEIFLKNYEDLIHVPFIMGVGGSFDVISGITRRAPLWVQNIGLEWFFRFLQEPTRMWKRYLITNSLFIYYVFSEKMKKIFGNQ